MKRSKLLICWNISGVLLLIAIVLNLSNQRSQIPWLSLALYAALFLFIGASVLLKKYLRCPHCGKPIHPKSAAMTHCPHCGKKFN